MFGKHLGSTGRERKLSIERLEDKTLLAGDVQVFVAHGDLYIIGDREDNHIQVVATAEAGEYRVLGVNRGEGEGEGEGGGGGDDGAPTTINGELGQIRVHGVTDDIKIDMRGGNSRVALLGSEVTNGASGGEGDILELVVPDDLLIRNQSGTANVHKGDFRGAEGNHREDRLEVFTENVRVRDDLVIYTKDGYDDIALLETLVNDNLYICTRGGDDDVLLRDVAVYDKAIINLGDGEDLASVEDTLVHNLLDIRGGRDRDIIQIRDTCVDDEIRICGDAGNDSLRLLDVEARRMDIDLGCGDDRLDLSGVHIHLYAHINGGRGYDSVGADHDDNWLHGLVGWNFEEFGEFDDTFIEVEIEPEPEPEPEPFV